MDTDDFITRLAASTRQFVLLHFDALRRDVNSNKERTQRLSEHIARLETRLQKLEKGE